MSRMSIKHSLLLDLSDAVACLPGVSLESVEARLDELYTILQETLIHSTPTFVKSWSDDDVVVHVCGVKVSLYDYSQIRSVIGEGVAKITPAGIPLLASLFQSGFFTDRVKQEPPIYTSFINAYMKYEHTLSDASKAQAIEPVALSA